MQRLFLLFLSLLFLPLYAFSPSSPYQEQFGEAYQEAVTFCKEQQADFEAVGQQYDIAPELMSAIVFPELIRFDAFRDFFETQSLELLYVQGVAVDFSIGQFQMKPSFAEFIEARANEDTELAWAVDFQALCSFGAGDEQARRKERLSRLKDHKWQLHYLAAYIKYVSQTLDPNLDELQQTQLLATRYNCGPQKSWEEVKPWMHRKSFPYGPQQEADQQFSYQEVALHFYQKLAAQIYK